MNVNWIQVAQVRIQCRVAVNTVNNFRHHNKWGIWLTGKRQSVSRERLLLSVSDTHAPSKCAMY